MSGLEELRALIKSGALFKSSSAFATAVHLIRDFNDQELITIYHDLALCRTADVETKVEVEILFGVIFALVEHKNLSAEEPTLPNAHAGIPVQTLTIDGKSFQVRKGTQLPINAGNRNDFKQEFVGTYTSRTGETFNNEKIRYFLTIKYGFGVQFVGLAKQRTNAKKTSEIDHFAFTSFETTDANWAAMFTEFQAVLNGVGEIELPPKFYDKLVSEGKIV